MSSELAQQLQAIENAINNAKKALIHEHVDHCLNDSAQWTGPKRRAALKNLRDITKYLQAEASISAPQPFETPDVSLT